MTTKKGDAIDQLIHSINWKIGNFSMLSLLFGTIMALIDIAMMVRAWGAIPDAAWCKAERVYGQSVRIAYGRAVALLNDREYLARCLSKMGMDQQWLAGVPAALAAHRPD